MSTAEAIQVVLLVDDMVASLAFYASLAFTPVALLDAHRSRVPADAADVAGVAFAMLRRDAAMLMLEARASIPALHVHYPASVFPTDGPLGGTAIVYIRGVDPDAARAALPSTVPVLREPVTEWYGVREMTVRDPVNGYVITFAKSTA